MPIVIEEDTGRIGGHAIVTLGAVPADADLRFKIRRMAGETVNLGPHGWQNSEALLESLETREGPDGTALLWGPEVCDWIEESTYVEISFPGIGMRESLFWPYIAPSAKVQDQKQFGQPTPAPAPPPTTAPIPGLTPITDDTDEDEASEPGPTDNEELADSSGHEGKDDEQGNPADDTIVEPDKPKSRRLWLAVIPVLLIALAGGGYYWYSTQPAGVEKGNKESIVHEDEKTDKKSDGEKKTVEDKKTEETKEREAAKKPEESSETTKKETERLDDKKAQPAKDPMDILREKRANGATPQEIYEQGIKFIGSGEYNAGIAAINSAAEDNNPAALYQLGKWYDPKSFDPKIGISKPNAVTAARYYKRAVTAGMTDAKSDFDSVCADLKKTVSGPGDTVAVTFEQLCKQ